MRILSTTFVCCVALAVAVSNTSPLRTARQGLETCAADTRRATQTVPSFVGTSAKCPRSHSRAHPDHLSPPHSCVLLRLGRTTRVAAARLAQPEEGLAHRAREADRHVAERLDAARDHHLRGRGGTAMEQSRQRAEADSNVLSARERGAQPADTKLA
eukprot:4987792-Pleurochrysis_carterae.AAC.2